MKTFCKIALEFFVLFVLTFMLSVEHILIANVYDIPCITYFFVAVYCMCGWLSHRAFGMHNVHFGAAITTLLCIVTFFLVECTLHKDEKGCDDWILKVIEANSKGRDGSRKQL